MGCILVFIALIFPRICILVLWLFTNWFTGVFSTILIPIVGFIFAPLATLWYGVVFHYYNGEWNLLTIAIMILALAIDFGSLGSGESHRRRL